MRLAGWMAAGMMALAPMAWAQRPYDDFDRGQSTRYFERAPDRHEMDNVVSMARRLDDVMEKVEKRAKKEAEDLDLSRRENEALRQLKVLISRADTFKDTVERASDRPNWTVDDFESLLGAYLLVDEHLDTLYRSNLLGGEFRRVQSLMDSLASYYGGYPPYASRQYDRLTRRAEGDEDADDEDVGFSYRPARGRYDNLDLELPDIDLPSSQRWTMP